MVPPHGAAFDPATIAVMAAAYDKAVAAQSASAREDIAKRILALAFEGELDPDKLCNGALALCVQRVPLP